MRRWNKKRKPTHVTGHFYKVEDNLAVKVYSLYSKSHTRVNDGSYKKRWRKFKGYHFNAFFIIDKRRS